MGRGIRGYNHGKRGKKLQPWEGKRGKKLQPWEGKRSKKLQPHGKG
ncbi:hypothetical protein [Candidatus Cardinium hertigii]|nr:hypothetical protein [Candidatus Cardinium hertigii]